jgi:hypothetical protein
MVAGKKKSFSQGLKPNLCELVNARAKARAYLRSKSKISKTKRTSLAGFKQVLGRSQP